MKLVVKKRRSVTSWFLGADKVARSQEFYSSLTILSKFKDLIPKYKRSPQDQGGKRMSRRVSRRDKTNDYFLIETITITLFFSLANTYDVFSE